MDFVLDLFKKLVILAIVGGGAFFGWKKYQDYSAQKAASAITAEQLMAVQPGTTLADITAQFGTPTKTSTGGTERENSVRSGTQAAKFVYYRRGTVMFVFNSQDQCVEICVGETTDDYYDRGAGKTVLWQQIQDNGFVHNDVMGAGGIGGNNDAGIAPGVGAGAAGIM